MPDFSGLADVILEGRTYALEVAKGHLARFDSPAIKISMTQNMRSAIIARMAAGATDFQLDPKHTEHGRVFFRFPGTKGGFHLKAKASLPFCAKLPLTTGPIDDADDLVFILAFDFEDEDLVLEIAPARREGQPGKLVYQMLDYWELLGRYSLDSITDTPATFDQTESDAGGDRWWDGFGANDDETGTEE